MDRRYEADSDSDIPLILRRHSTRAKKPTMTQEQKHSTRQLREARLNRDSDISSTDESSVQEGKHVTSHFVYSVDGQAGRPHVTVSQPSAQATSAYSKLSEAEATPTNSSTAQTSRANDLDLDQMSIEEVLLLARNDPAPQKSFKFQNYFKKTNWECLSRERLEKICEDYGIEVYENSTKKSIARSLRAYVTAIIGVDEDLKRLEGMSDEERRNLPYPPNGNYDVNYTYPDKP